jgi:adenylate cyclase
MVIGLMGNDKDVALDAIERALSANRSSAVAYYFGAELYAWSGDPVTATDYAQRALRLSPFDPLAYVADLAIAMAAFQEGRYEASAAYWAKCDRANPGFAGFAQGQAMALALAGRIEEAKRIFARGVELEPGFCIRTIIEMGLVPALAEKYVRAARLLGVPE